MHPQITMEECTYPRKLETQNIHSFCYSLQAMKNVFIDSDSDIRRKKKTRLALYPLNLVLPITNLQME